MSDPVSAVIAIDGPAASGKSTVARRVAAARGDLYVDSGALYRAVTGRALIDGVAEGDTDGIIAAMRGSETTFRVENGAVCFSMGGEVDDAVLRSDAVNERVSEVAAVPEVRAQIVAWLQAMRELGNLVMEGRDIGTVVFPGTPYKFYLDADPAERARRRKAETDSAQGEHDVSTVLSALKRRDARDSSRATAPLTVADGAVVLDTTRMSIEDVVAAILEHVGE